ncbi:otefin-like [Lutzomyia longipalpis]|uniref:LEM domain-containing protein n=2 Tax=Lutzomyia longipalpis TaxID=7200 RepID=A0A1B0FUZ6_LUTLO|nr:otefin-like [Lutzomyia longipalpis]
MSADPDNLEALSNDELRHQMSILGLPKVPITDTTRKVLIKRIRNHLKEAKTKTRRETVAVVKYSSDEDVASEPEVAKGKTNRRATLAAPVAAPKVPEKVSAQVKPQRRSGRITPTQVSLVDVPPPAKIAMSPVVSHIIEDSDEEADEILTQFPPARRSKSKSPSLSRSDVVTTSYKQVIESVKESPEEEEEAMDVDVPPRPPSRPSQAYYRPSPSYKLLDSGLENRRTIGGFSGTRYSSYTPSYESRYSTLSTQYSQKRDAQEEQDEQLETPYLSDFTRRLSQLKAHRLDAAAPVYRADSSTTKPTNSISASIAALFNALDRKYNLKRNLLILSAVLLVILLFVLFLY